MKGLGGVVAAGATAGVEATGGVWEPGAACAGLEGTAAPDGAAALDGAAAPDGAAAAGDAVSLGAAGVEADGAGVAAVCAHAVAVRRGAQATAPASKSRILIKKPARAAAALQMDAPCRS